MAESSGRKQEITVGDDFDAVVRYGGTTVELSPNGSVIVKTKGDAVVFTNGDVKVRPAANDSSETAEPKIGDRMVDGTIYAGISPDTDRRCTRRQPMRR